MRLRFLVSAVVLLGAMPAVASGRDRWTLTGQRPGLAGVARATQEPAQVSPDVLRQRRYLARSYVLPIRVIVHMDAAAACGAGYYCVTPADRVLHISRPVQSDEVAHEVGHVLDYTLALRDPAAAARFRARWQALNAFSGPWYGAPHADAPAEQFASSFSLCADDIGAREASRFKWEYDYRPNAFSYEATCRLLRREVRRLG